MTEPTSATAGVLTASVTGGAVVLVGPVFGPWVAVLLAALIGAQWPVGKAKAKGDSRAGSLLLLGRIVMTALVLTGAVAAAVLQALPEQWQAWGHEHALTAVAFAIAMVGDKFESFRTALAARIKSWIGGATEGGKVE